MSKLDRFCFITEYYDNYATMIRKFYLFYYPKDNTIEISEIKNKKMFLKRCTVPDIDSSYLYLGNEINIYSRLHKLVDYGDNFTKNYFEEMRSNTFGLIKPDAYLNIGKIIDMIYQYDFNISRLKLCKMSKDDAALFYSNIQNDPAFLSQVNYITSDFIVGIDLVKKNAINEWSSLINDPQNSPFPQIFGNNDLSRYIHGSASSAETKKESNLIFNKINHKPNLTSCSCLIIKPHIINEGLAGKIIDIILTEGFEITSMEMISMDKTQAEEFFEIYKGVLPEYKAMIDAVICGPVIVIEVRQNDCVNKLRNLVGPYDPDIAKALRPNTIRAKFGQDSANNAVHCTDLEEDAFYECNYIFNKLCKIRNNSFDN